MKAAAPTLDIELIKRKTISGIVTFTFRTFIIQIFTLFSTFILTILLSPKVFGIFYLVSAILNLFIYFSDIGLAAALIQRKEEPEKEDFSTVFFLQQAIIVTLVVLGFLLSHKISVFYKLDAPSLFLFRILIFSLFLSSLKTIPSVILERHLNFTRLVIPQILESITFYTVAIILAFYKFDLSSFTWAVLARGIVGLITIYVVSPWKPSLKFNIRKAKILTSFGVPFQLNSILALLKDDLLTVFIGKILPYSEIGYIGWSQKFAFMPLRFVMDNVIKVTFPSYSRLQHDLTILKQAIEKSIFFVTFLVYPMLAGIMLILPKLVKIIPNYQKWEPAVPLLLLFVLNAAFAAVNTTLTNVMFAMGKPKIILKLMVFWTILSWILTYLLVKILGFQGVALASALVAASTSITIYFVKKEVDVSIFKNIFAPLVSSLIMYGVLRIIDPLIPNSIFGLVIIFFTSIMIYFSLALLILGKKIIEDTQKIFNVLRKNTKDLS